MFSYPMDLVDFKYCIASVTETIVRNTLKLICGNATCSVYV